MPSRPSPPSSSLLAEPPSWGFSMKIRPPSPPFLAPLTPFPSPEQKKTKNIRNVHQVTLCLPQFTTLFRATLKGTSLRGQTPICGFLRVLLFSAVAWENSAVSAKICASQMLRSPGKDENQRKSAKIRVWAHFVPLGLSP